MTSTQLTPEHPPTERHPLDGTADGDIDGPDGGIVAPGADELRRAQARRLEIMERERATSEGMPPPEPRLLPRVDHEDGEGDDVHG